MRKGFTIVEMLVVIIVLPFILLVLDGLYKTLLTNIPASYRIAQENTTLLDMLEQMHRDIDKATGLPESFAGQTANDKLVIIELDDSVICYQIKDGRAIRRKLIEAGQGYAEEERVWSLPSATLEWQVWKRDGKGYAVQTKSHVEHKVRDSWEKKMAHSNLFFVGALGKELR